MNIRLVVLREDAIYLMDAINTERFRLQDLALDARAAGKADADYLYRLGCLEEILLSLDSLLDAQFQAVEPSNEELEAMADYYQADGA